MPDALALLHADHEAVLDLLTRLGQTSGAVERGELAATVVKELRAHTRVEEDVFYPAVAESVPDGAGFVQVSREEHGKAAAQLDTLEKLSPEDRGFAPAAGELTRLVKEHVADEEMQLFPRVRTAMGAERLAELGTRIEERKGMAAAGRRRSR